MRKLGIDLETFSSVPITKGVYKYVDSSDFEILLCGYAFDEEPVKVIDLTQGEKIPEEVQEALFDSQVVKTAYNANFELTCLTKHLGRKMHFNEWRCSSVLALTMGLPGYLAGVATALGFPEDKQKMAVGKRLIQYFCVPCKATKTNGGRLRNLPTDDLEKWELFKTYCGQDVEVEREIGKQLASYLPNDKEYKLWQLDQTMQQRGVAIDLKLVENAIKFDEQVKAEAIHSLKLLTGLSNPASTIQFKTWIENELNETIDSIAKEPMGELLKREDLPSKVREGILLKQLISKTSVKKYQAMQESVCKDGRLHGMLQFYGTRTGRWAGRIVQVHNLPQNHLEDLDFARKFLYRGDFETLEMLYDNPSDVLSQLIRTAFIASAGSRFIVADFSAIEARVIAWLAGEEWRQKVFADGGDIYCASASAMFHVPVEKHGINGDLRQKGKVAELALGYQGGVGALIAMGALKMGIKEEELQPIVDKWREASTKIVQLWNKTEAAAKTALTFKGTEVWVPSVPVSFEVTEDNFLLVNLPSGRSIAYYEPSIMPNRFGHPAITFMGMNQTTKKWERTETYGGKLVENIVQAVARDCLAESMLALDEAGYKIVFHVHDEVILDMPYGKGSLKEAINIMTRNAPWNTGLKLNADGYETEYYKKD